MYHQIPTSGGGGDVSLQVQKAPELMRDSCFPVSNKRCHPAWMGRGRAQVPVCTAGAACPSARDELRVRIPALLHSPGFAVLGVGCSPTATHLCARKAAAAGQPTGWGWLLGKHRSMSPAAAAGPSEGPLCRSAAWPSAPRRERGSPHRSPFPSAAPARRGGLRPGAAARPRCEGCVCWKRSAAAWGRRSGRALGVAVQGVAFRAALIR